MASRSQRDAEDMMLVDEDFDAEGDDQLIDDDETQAALPTETASPSSFDAPTLPEQSHLNSRRRRPQDGSVGPQASIDKSVRKREQREREKEQQKQLLAKLIEIFGMHFLVFTCHTSADIPLTPFAEAGGGTCAVQQGQKKFPWVDLPSALIRIGCYFAGWPEKCLPKMSDKHPDRIDASTGPSQWSLKQKRAMEAQINKGAVKVLPRPDSKPQRI
jgi:hypothetical protein